MGNESSPAPSGPSPSGREPNRSHPRGNQRGSNFRSDLTEEERDLVDTVYKLARFLPDFIQAVKDTKRLHQGQEMKPTAVAAREYVATLYGAIVDGLDPRMEVLQ